MSTASVRSKSWSFLGAVLLASGTCIGAGMLALPVLTALAGFFPACIIYLISWAVMAYSSFLFLEVTLSMNQKETNIMSMAEATLGSWGKKLTFVTYIFLFYSVSIAYLSGSGSIISDALQSLLHVHIPKEMGTTLSLLLFGPSIYFGTKAVANLNSLLVAGIAISYVFLIGMGSSHVQVSHYAPMNWSYAWMGIPVIVTSFTFQNVIPSISRYLDNDVNQLKKVMVLGGLIPLLIYMLWQWFVMGVVPIDGAYGIKQMLAEGSPISHSLKHLLGSKSVITFSQIFAFCAIMTSFLGVILSLFDFMADGLKIKKEGSGKILLCLLIFLPPFMCCLIYPKAFLSALNYAGSFGCVTLFMLLPALMAYQARYRLKLNAPFTVKGGKGALFALFLIGISIMVVQMLLSFNVLKNV